MLAQASAPVYLREPRVKIKSLMDNEPIVDRHRTRVQVLVEDDGNRAVFDLRALNRGSGRIRLPEEQTWQK